MSKSTAPGQPQVKNPFFSRIYPRINAFSEKHGGREHRQEMLADAVGTVLEVGAGNGGNFAYYPQAVDEVLALEPEPRLRRLAEQAAARSSVPVKVRAGLAEDLPPADGSVDTVVTSLVLCTVPDVPRALGEVARVLRPGGRLHFYEHVLAADARLARLQRIFNLVWPKLGAGCNLTRDTEGAIIAAGFTIERIRRFDFIVNARRSLSSPCIIGVARKPGA